MLGRPVSVRTIEYLHPYRVHLHPVRNATIQHNIHQLRVVVLVEAHRIPRSHNEIEIFCYLVARERREGGIREICP